MSATGKPTNVSTGAFVSALVLGLIVMSALLAVWFVLRNKNKRVYQPRTFLPPVNKRATELPSSPIAWLRAVWGEPDKSVLATQGVDAYFFIRFIRLSVLIFGPVFPLTWLILMPVYGTGHKRLAGVEQFTFGNIGNDQQNRLVATFLIAIIFTFYILYLIHIEYQHYRVVRQEWLQSEAHKALARARTVVIVNVPEQYMDEEKIRELATGSVAQVWLSRQVKDMEKIYDDRNKEVMILENAEGSVLTLAAKNKRKEKMPEKSATVEAGDVIARYIATKKRPSHRRQPLGFLPLTKKYDTLNDSPVYIKEKEAELQSARDKMETLPMGNSVFIRFSSQEEAHAFAKGVPKLHKETRMVRAAVEVVPEDVVWENLKMTWAMRKARTAISWALTIGLIIIWAIPVAFVGSFSNISSLANSVSFLGFINSIPSIVRGIIQGVLPPVLLAVLFMVLPMILRAFVKAEGKVLRSEIELEVFTRFWLFQVIHGFLIVTLASGLTSALADIGGQIAQLPTMLAEGLPSASTFFLQWLALYALTSFGLSVSRVVPFAMDKFGRGFLAGSTPRKTFRFGDKMLQLAFATTWPPLCLLMCVGVVYTTIQPIITLFGLFTFSLLYIMYKYVLIWVCDQGDALETGGEYMRKAIDSIFVALYLELIMLAALFFLSSNDAGGRSPAGLAGGVLMVILIVLVAVFQFWTCHIRHPKAACHYIDPIYNHQSGSRVAIRGEDGEAHAYPPNAGTGNDETRPVHGNTDGFFKEAFDHPAVWKPAPVVWIANDSLDIGTSEAARLNATGVKASTDYATMDPEGKIDVHRTAPDEAWYGGISKA